MVGWFSKEIVKSGVIVTGLMKGGAAIGLRGFLGTAAGRVSLAAGEALVDQGSQEGNMSGMVRDITRPFQSWMGRRHGSYDV